LAVGSPAPRSVPMRPANAPGGPSVRPIARRPRQGRSAWRARGLPRSRPQCLNGSVPWLQVRCHRCKTEANVPLGCIRRPRDTPIWKLEAALKCRSCRSPRYSPPGHMIKAYRRAADGAVRVGSSGEGTVKEVLRPLANSSRAMVKSISLDPRSDLFAFRLWLGLDRWARYRRLASARAFSSAARPVSTPAASSFRRNYGTSSEQLPAPAIAAALASRPQTATAPRARLERTNHTTLRHHARRRIAGVT
jgi:hypothetical protein